MIRPESMVRVLIVGPSEKQGAVIERLQELNLLHVRDFKGEDSVLKSGRNQDSVSKDAELLYKLRLAGGRADLRAGKGSGNAIDEKLIEKEIRSEDGRIHQMIDHVLRLSEEIVKARSKVQSIEDRTSFLEKVRDLGMSLEDLQDYDNITLIIGSLERRADRQLRASFPGILIKRPTHSKSEVVAFFVPSERQKALREHLGNTRFAEIKVPHLPRPTGAKRPDDLIKAYMAEKVRLNAEIERAEARIRKEMSSDREHLLAAEEYLAMKVQRGEFPTRIATGRVAFAIDGWIPRSKMGKLQDLRRTLGDDVAIVEAQDDGEEAPTLMRHIPPADNFEVFTKMYSPPKRNEIDPTAILAITFPLFFGFIVGDMGYGVMIALFAIYLRYFRFIGIGGKELSNILLISAASSFLWGLIFGEVFGIPLAHEEGFDYSIQGLFGITLPYHGLISKIADVKLLMMASIVAGFLQLLLGLSIGAYNEYPHNKRRAILGKGGWILILTGFFTIIFLVLGGIDLPINGAFIALPCLVLGIAGLIAGEGVLTTLETLSILTNTLSYVRLFAVGLAKAGIAIAVDSITLKIISGNMWPLGILAFFGAHFGLMFLAILSAGLHSIRLNYVEFFSKFYEGGGHLYAPFGFIRRLTKRGEKDGS